MMDRHVRGRKRWAVALLVIVLVALFGLLTVTDASPQDFRATRWGMSVAEVIEAIGSPRYVSGATPIFTDSLVYYEGIADAAARLRYCFAPEGLVTVNIWFDDPDDGPALFRRISSALSHRYGAPTLEKPLYESYWFLPDSMSPRTVIILEYDFSDLMLIYADFRYILEYQTRKVTADSQHF